MTTEVPSWKDTANTKVNWTMGHCDGIQAGFFSHGPSPTSDVLRREAIEGDVLVARDAEDNSLVALYAFYGNQFLRLEEGFGGKLFKTIVASIDDGLERRNEALKIAERLSRMSLTDELDDANIWVLQRHGRAFDKMVTDARLVTSPHFGALELDDQADHNQENPDIPKIHEVVPLDLRIEGFSTNIVKQQVLDADVGRDPEM